MATSIEILESVKPPLRWFPVLRDFTREFLDSKSKDPNGPSFEDLTNGPDSVLYEAQRILGRCLPPTQIGEPETGLVVGYVQSGKTLSFETVISLARDNGYGLVIVLAGTKNNLRDQSEDRLKKDLGIDDGGDHWYPLSNPNKAAKGQIESKINAWKRNATKKSLLITVLKHGGHLEKLADLLKGIDLTAVPSLIIDDESDQASLNTKAARIKAGLAQISEQSTTYATILGLRKVLPHHSYLQYTATPQANLLLAQSDFLNPDFAELVTPGDAYTGGKSFFLDNSNLVEEIPTKEVPTPKVLISTTPKSLIKALRYFLLVAAQHSLTRSKGMRGKDRNRSMMVHPALATSSHKLYKSWVEKAYKGLHKMIVQQYGSNPQSIEAIFSAEHASLLKTHSDLRPLSDLIPEMIDEVFDELNIVEVNGTPDAEKKVNWKQTSYWILVGGAKLDRGYTVEGLCVTYMPRPLGASPAADTLQQRARFFGYKSRYLGLCRVFLQSAVCNAFKEYVEHEEFVRDALVANRGKPLKEWKRDFILTAALRPTRANVIGLGVRRISADGWLVPQALQWGQNSQLTENRELMVSAIKSWEKKSPRQNASVLMQSLHSSPHDVIEAIPLTDVLKDFLIDFQVKEPQDSEDYNAMIIALAQLLASNPDLKVDVFLMNKLSTVYRTRVAGRGIKNPKDPLAPMNQYFSQSAGTLNDRDCCFKDRITLQLRRFDLGTVQRDSTSADVKDIAWFAINVPSMLRKDLLIEKRS